MSMLATLVVGLNADFLGLLKGENAVSLALGELKFKLIADAYGLDYLANYSA